MTFPAVLARPQRPTSIAASALSIGLALVLLSGCAAGTPAPVQSTPAAVPTGSSAEPTAEPTEDPDAGGTAPAQAFDGDCSLVFSTQEITDLAGWAAADPVAFVSTVPDMALVHQVGGLGCVWSPAGGDEGYLQLTVVPQKELSKQVENGTTCFLQSEKTYICAIDLDANGYHLSANFTTANTASYNKANAISGRIADAFTAHAEVLDQAATPKQPTGAWPLDFSCADLGKKAKIGTALGNKKLKISDGGGDVQVTAAETDLWGGRPFLRCYWADPEAELGTIAQVTVAVLGGAAWTQQEIAVLPGAEEVDVEGAERAIVVTDPNGLGSTTGDLHIFDGVNWLVLSSEGIDPAELYPAVKVLLKGLDRL